MVDFLLFQLNPDLLQKVIYKVLLLTFSPPLCTFQLNANSYFRLQQACRGVGQFIRTCQNICIHEEGRYVLCSKDGQSSYHLYHLGHRTYIDVECFYGTRINQLRPRGQLVPIPSFTQFRGYRGIRTSLLLVEGESNHMHEIINGGRYMSR